MTSSSSTSSITFLFWISVVEKRKIRLTLVVLFHLVSDAPDPHFRKQQEMLETGNQQKEETKKKNTWTKMCCKKFFLLKYFSWNFLIHLPEHHHQHYSFKTCIIIIMMYDKSNHPSIHPIDDTRYTRSDKSDTSWCSNINLEDDN